jgi:hypothetical protein
MFRAKAPTEKILKKEQTGDAAVVQGHDFLPDQTLASMSRGRLVVLAQRQPTGGAGSQSTPSGSASKGRAKMLPIVAKLINRAEIADKPDHVKNRPVEPLRPPEKGPTKERERMDDPDSLFWRGIWMTVF